MENISTELLLDFHRRQLEVWPMAASNFGALKHLEVKDFNLDGLHWRVQHNPARIASTAAKVDRASLAARPCFLCASNRPASQMVLPAGSYEVLVNPFPLFPVHFTIPACKHIPQLITADRCSRFADMLGLAKRLPGLALFYNGPACGASAPDHFHFQAVERSQLPIFNWVEDDTACRMPFKVETSVISNTDDGCRWLASLCTTLAMLPENAGQKEPSLNILCAADDAGKSVRVIVIPRRAHRPDFYGTAPSQLLLSPASVDLSGVIVAPSADDFHRKLTPAHLYAMFEQTCYTR